MVAPVLEQIAQEYHGKILVKKLDVDANPVTPSQHQVTGIPIMIMFKPGQPIERSWVSVRRRVFWRSFSRTWLRQAHTRAERKPLGGFDFVSAWARYPRGGELMHVRQ
jgi:hypothetical protein